MVEIYFPVIWVVFGVLNVYLVTRYTRWANSIQGKVPGSSWVSKTNWWVGIANLALAGALGPLGTVSVFTIWVMGVLVVNLSRRYRR